MVDVARSQAELAAIYADGQPNFSISEQDHRDGVASWNARTEISAEEYGVSPSASASVNRAGLDAAFAAAVAAKKGIVLPGGNIHYVNPWRLNNIWVGVRGTNFTSLIGTDNTQHGVHIGTGTPTGYPTGYWKDITCDNEIGTLIANGKSALRLDGMTHFQVKRAAMGRYDIGIDLVNNCFASSFDTIRVGFGLTNCPLYLRQGSQSGSDLSFKGFWANGVNGAVWIAGGGGGYSFQDCQFSSGFYFSSADDNSGCVILNKDYLTGAAGSFLGNVAFKTCSFEGGKWVWAIRVFESTTFSCTQGCGFNGAIQATPMIGVVKASAGTHGRWAFHDSNITGHWSNPYLAVNTVAPSNPWSLEESNWHSGSTSSSVNGVTMTGNNWMKSLAGFSAQAGASVGKGRATLVADDGSMVEELVNGSSVLWRRNNAGAYEKSTNFGGAWSAV